MSLVDDSPAICADRRNTVPARWKTFELRMKPIAFDIDEKHLLREQPFLP
jgi:hypothetical protein